MPRTSSVRGSVYLLELENEWCYSDFSDESPNFRDLKCSFENFSGRTVTGLVHVLQAQELKWAGLKFPMGYHG